MKRLMPRLVLVVLVAVLCVVLVSLSAEAGEKKKISGTNKLGTVLARSIAFPDNFPKHEMHQLVRKDTVISCSDPEWVGMELWTYDQNDRMGGKVSDRGYNVYLLKSGEKVFVRFESPLTITAKEGGAWEITGEGSYEYIGGTGKFKDLKGRGTYKAKITPEMGISIWEGEMEY